MKMPIAKTTAASAIGSRSVVRGWTGSNRYRGSYTYIIPDGVGDFPSLQEYNSLDLEWWTNSSQITLSMLSLFPDIIFYAS